MIVLIGVLLLAIFLGSTLLVLLLWIVETHPRRRPVVRQVGMPLLIERELLADEQDDAETEELFVAIAAFLRDGDTDTEELV